MNKNDINLILYNNENSDYIIDFFKKITNIKKIIFINKSDIADQLETLDRIKTLVVLDNFIYNNDVNFSLLIKYIKTNRMTILAFNKGAVYLSKTLGVEVLVNKELTSTQEVTFIDKNNNYVDFEVAKENKYIFNVYNKNAYLKAINSHYSTVKYYNEKDETIKIPRNFVEPVIFKYKNVLFFQYSILTKDNILINYIIENIKNELK